MEEKLYEYKRIKFEGANHYLIRLKGEKHFKHHRIDGPAIVPQRKDSKFTKSWFLQGIEYTEEDFNEIKKEREGLPWYKSPSMKGNMRF